MGRCAGPVGLVVVAMCGLVSAACRSTPPARTAPPNVLSGVSAEEAARVRRIGAMVSVRAHVASSDELLKELLEEVGIMSLREAASVLEHDESVRGQSRSLRALATLSAAYLAEQPPVVGGRLEQIEGALHDLGLSKGALEKLRSNVDLQYPFLLEGPLAINIPWLEWALGIQFPKWFPGLFPGILQSLCFSREAKPGPSVSPYGKIPVVLHTKVSVSIPVDDVAQNIDPQRWDECSDFWRPPPDNTRIYEWSGGVGVPHPNPPATGSHYPAQMLLREKFACAECADAKFDQLLCVSVRCDPPQTSTQKCTNLDSYMVDYDLPIGLEGDCGCPTGSCPAPCSEKNSLWWLYSAKVGNTDVVLCRDDGHVYATKDPNDPGRTIVEAVKYVHFDPDTLTYALRAAFAFYLDEMNRALGALACCY